MWCPLNIRIASVTVRWNKSRCTSCCGGFVVAPKKVSCHSHGFHMISHTWENDMHSSQGVSFCRSRLPVKGRFWKSLKLTFKAESSRKTLASYESNSVHGHLCIWFLSNPGWKWTLRILGLIKHHTCPHVLEESSKKELLGKIYVVG